MSKSPIRSIDRTLSGSTTQGLSGPASDVNEEVVHIHQSSSITKALPSDFFGEGVLPLSRDAISAFCNPSRLG